MDSNLTLQVNRANPQSPHIPIYIELAIALEIDERLPLPNYADKMRDVILINTIISPLRINFNKDSSLKLNFTYPPPASANNNQLQFFEQQAIDERNRIHQPSILLKNPIQPKSPQILYQIREVEPQEAENLDKQILKLQEERDMMQLRFKQEVHDTVFGNLDCPSDLSNNEMGKQSQSENSEEAKNSLSIQDDKEMCTKKDKQNENENAEKAKILLIKEKQKENHKEMDKKAKMMITQSLELLELRIREEDIREIKNKGIIATEREKSQNINDDQTRNYRSRILLFQSKPEVMKKKKQTPNSSKVLQDSHISYPAQLKRELLTLKSKRVG
ncbi:MAG: hypothetical protein EZS28_038906 [Streblomastix strix]|uniref:Uncharacterized protein n=1 Tax=Streblomastix strix TaxID=222440 RepID=A0A5J4U4P0_9EUKA|nr:MAG: hypothetical protein EZS28_038906 [Streblomastix strix]